MPLVEMNSHFSHSRNTHLLKWLTNGNNDFTASSTYCCADMRIVSFSFFSSLFCRTRREIIIVSIIDLAAFMQAICNMVFIEGTLSFFLRTQTSQTTQSNEAREKPNTKNSCSFISSLCDDDNSECARLALQRRWREKKNGTKYFLYLGQSMKKRNRYCISLFAFLLVFGSFIFPLLFCTWWNVATLQSSKVFK